MSDSPSTIVCAELKYISFNSNVVFFSLTCPIIPLKSLRFAPLLPCARECFSNGLWQIEIFISSAVRIFLAKFHSYSNAHKLSFFVATLHTVHPIRTVANNNILFTCFGVSKYSTNYCIDCNRPPLQPRAGQSVFTSYG